jgi:hypothetical protein
VLQKLGSHSDATVRKWVTLHPNTPPRVLAKLATQFPEQLLDNPVFDVLPLENPNLLNELPVGTRRSLLKREKCPVSFLEWLAQDDDEGVQLALAMNPNTPAHILQKLSQSGSSKVANAAKRHVSYPGASALEKGNPNEALDIALSQELLSRSELKQARLLAAWLVAHGPPESGSVPSLARWVQKQLWRALSRLDCVPATACLQLATDPDRDIRQAVAEKPHTPGPALKFLSEESSPAIREAVARNRETPPQVLASLAGDESGAIRAGVAANTSTPPSVLQEMAEDRSTSVRANVAWNPVTPASALERLAAHGDKYAWSLATNNALPAEMLSVLAKHKDKMVKERVAENSNTPQDVLENWASRKSYTNLHKEIANNRSAPAAVLRALAAHPNEYVRRSVARNPATPTDILRYLSKAKDRLVRCAVAENSATPTDILLDLSKTEDWLVRRSLASNCRAPREILRALAQDEEPDVRLEVARNPKTPRDTLKALADSEVRHHEDLLGHGSWGWLWRFWDLGLALANNPSTPARVRASLVCRDSLLIPALEPEALEEVIALDAVPECERPAARGAIAAELLSEHGKSNRPSIKRLACLLLDDCPVPTLAKAVRSTDWKERLAIATHPKTPPAIRKQLANDGNEIVRAAAGDAMPNGAKS